MKSDTLNSIVHILLALAIIFIAIGNMSKSSKINSLENRINQLEQTCEIESVEE